MPPKRESLFSLELVVEKLYIPNSTCRFPAVAFRLLDFPTILIEHVEPDLAEKIRHKIKVDPYYTVPHQFHELKDRDGNFLMKKGKSCLFRITTDTLKMHLSNTPLYVMIIDNFPEVPKLMGNSTIPLNEVMDSILTDIRKLGENVPSVHGDKGLYKIYSLMGKEIGYIIMAYRLLSLGPGLIPHIPETAIATRISEKKIVPEKEVKTSSASSATDVHRFQENRFQGNLNSTQEMGSMTEPEKCDVMLQTIEMCDKQIHVAVSAPENEEEKKDKRIFNTAGTQTIKQKKQRPIKIKNRLNVELDASDEDDGMVITDIAQPPPLFYNSEAEPSVKIQHSYSYSDDGSSEYEDDIPTESISENDQVEKEKVDVEKTAQNFYEQYRKYPNYNDQQQLVYHKSESIPKKLHHYQGDNTSRANVNFLQAFSNMSGSTGAPFPLLNALMNELAGIQSNQVPHQVSVQPEQIVSTAAQQVSREPSLQQHLKSVSKPRYTPKTTVRRVQSVESKIGYEEQDDLSQSQFKHRSRKSHRGCAHPHDGVPKQRSWMRQAPELGVKKSKLAFGLTNTQRLRLSKVNPEWLKVIEKEEQEAKAQRKKPGRREEEPEFETGNLSDTLTEVRRLAARNLEDDQRNETLNQTDENMQSLPLSEVAIPTKNNIRRISPPRRGKSPLRKRRTSPLRKRSRSPKHKKIIQEEAKRHSDITEEESLTKTPATPKVSADEVADKELDEDLSSRSQKSIEVRIPSAQMYEEDDDSDISLSESDVPDGSYPNKTTKFPGFIDHNASIPESIKGKANITNNISKDFDNEEEFEPLESTRYSKQHEESQLIQSGDDYDTKQFHSTDEPELQRLMSSGEKSEVSDVLSGEKTDRSVNSPVPPSASWVSSKFQVINPKASLQSPIPAVRRSQVKLGSSTGRPTPTDSPRSSRASSKYPTPRASLRAKTTGQKRFEFKHDSIHTESVSSYAPSDASISLASDGAYSDDFHPGASDEDISRLSSPDEKLPKMIPSTKLGYTIH